MKIAVVDIDGILWSMSDVWYEELKKINPECPYPGKTETWDFHKGYMTDEQFQETIDTVHMQQYKYPCFKHAAVLTHVLNTTGFYVKIASHRCAESRPATETWLLNNGIYFDELYTVVDKHFLLEDATIFIDDNPKSQKFAVERLVTTFSIKYSYNKHMENVIFAKDFDGLLDKVSIWCESKRVLNEDNEERVTIRESHYKRLLDDTVLLATLREAGLEQWPQYKHTINNLTYNKERSVS